MRETKVKKLNETKNAVLIDTSQLMQILNCGYPTAIRLGNEAAAKVQTGRRVFWNRKKIESYIDAISE